MRALHAAADFPEGKFDRRAEDRGCCAAPRSSRSSVWVSWCLRHSLRFPFPRLWVAQLPIWRKSGVAFPIEVAAVAFDLDGTLIDTLPDLHESANRTLRDLGRDAVAESTVRDYVGDGVDRLVKRLLAAACDAEPDSMLFARGRALFYRHYAQILTRASRPFPGVMEAIDRMRAHGLKLACVTNKAEAFTRPLLDDVGLSSSLDLIVAGDTLSRRKPDPLPLAYCAQQFGVPAARLLMVGDSSNDTAAARAASCPVFCVAHGYRGGMALHELDCDAILPAVLDTLELIRPVRS